MKNDLIPWPLPAENEKKNYLETTHRACSPEETFERLKPLREAAGITRLSDVTYLDCLGIPTYVAIRPAVDLYGENITVYNGKGATKIQAKVSALMEAFERFSAERHNRPTILASLDEISRDGKAIDPRRLILPEGEHYEPDQPLDWVCGLDLISGETRFVPAAAAFCPFRSVNGGRFFKRFSNTNGLASGNTLGEAISQALAEVIERDAESMAELAGSAATIDLSSIQSPLVRGLIEKFRAAGIELVVKEMTSEFGIPGFFAVSDDPHTENPILLCKGLGAHVNAEIAVTRAITENAQVRLTAITGSREDLEEEEFKRTMNYHFLKKQMGYWYDSKPPLKDFGTMSLINNGTFLEDIETMLKPLRHSEFNEVIVVNLTHPSVNIPVVRVIVPGLEMTSVDPSRVGPRAHEKMKEKSISLSLKRPKGSRWFGDWIKQLSSTLGKPPRNP
jgi:ribosomal protein S12 methylthiotransferase accessory factor